MATQAMKQRAQKPALSRKKLQEVKALKRQALEYYEMANADHLDALTVELRLQQAKSSAALALKYNPVDTDTLNLFSRIALELGETSEARAALSTALDIHPRNGGYWYSLGHVALTEQQLDEAENCFKKAIRYSAKETRAESFLAYTLQAKGESVEAFQLYRELAKTKSSDPHIRSKLFECARILSADFYDPELEHDVLTFLNWEETNPQQLSLLTCSLLEHKLQFNDEGCAATSDEIANDPLFLTALKKVLIKSGNIEKLIMALRYELLLSATNQGQVVNDYLPLAVSISIYGHNSEYLLPITDAEKNMSAALRELCDGALNEQIQQPADISGALLLFSMYAPWTELTNVEKLLSFEDHLWPDYLLPLKARNAELHTLGQQSIDAINETASGVSQKVQQQYEEFPYPRWQTLDYKRTTHYHQALEQEYPHFKFPRYLNESNIRVLIAGCGTGRHALHVAKYFRDVDVTALDLSSASLAYAKTKSEEYDVKNIQFKQADLLNLDQSPTLPVQSYHIVECSGVLHHIKEYNLALSNLVNQLMPNGLIKIALYSERARKPVKHIREVFKRDDTLQDKNKIRMIRQAIMNAREMEGQEQLTESDDFYSMSGTVDLLFHEYETRFTPLKLNELCERHQLRFLGFSSLPIKVKHDFKALHGEQADLTDLSLWETFEIEHPTTFGQMYQFYCQKI